MTFCKTCNTELKIRIAMEGFVDEQYKVQNTYFFWCNSCEYGYYK